MAVAFDAVGPSSSGFKILSSSGTDTWTHTPVGTPTAVLVSVSAETSAGGNPTSVTVTYGGVAMTPLSSVASGGVTAGKVFLFGLASPPSGAQTVSVTSSPTTMTITGGSISYTGTATTTGTAFGTPVTKTAVSATTISGGISVTGVSANNRVFACFTQGNASNTVTVSTGTQRWSAVSTNANGAADSNTGGDTVSAVGSVTLNITMSPNADDIGAIAVEVLQAGATAAPNDPSRIQPSPAWQNRYTAGKLRMKAAVLHDGRLDQRLKPTAVACTATIPTPSLAITATPTAVACTATVPTPRITTTSNDLAHLKPGPAWRMRFGKPTQTSAILHDWRLDQNLHPTAVAATVNFPANDVQTITATPTALAVNTTVVTPVVTITATPIALAVQVTIPSVTPTIVSAAVAANDPGRAEPGPAWRNRFGRLSRLVTLFDGRLDQRLTPTAVACTANVVTPVVTITATLTALATQANIPAPLVTTTRLDPGRTLPGKAWRNRFTRTSRSAVLFDGRLDQNIHATAVATTVTVASDTLTVTATPTAVQATATIPSPLVITTSLAPSRALPGQAWRNFFGHLAKLPVFHDGRLDQNLKPTSLALPVTVASPIITITTQATALQVTANIPASVETITATPAALQVTITIPAPTISATAQVFITDPAQAQPGPAWRNRFSRLLHRSVLFDGRLDQSIKVTAVQATANLPATLETITATPPALSVPISIPAPRITTTSNDPGKTLPGRAWLNRFRRSRGLSAVLFDGRLDQNIHATALAVNVVIASEFVTETVTVSPVACTATIPTPRITTTSNDPQAALPGKAWLNRFARWRRFSAVQFDGRLDQNIHVSPVSCNVAIPSPTETITCTPAALGVSCVIPGPIVTAGAPPALDPSAAMPGRAWLNRFGKRLKLFTVLSDSQASPVAITATAVQATVSIPAPTLTITATPPAVSCSSSVPSPTCKETATESAVQATVTIPTPTINVVSPVFTSASATPGPAWLNRFRPWRKRKVLSDGRLDASLVMTAIPCAVHVPSPSLAIVAEPNAIIATASIPVPIIPTDARVNPSVLVLSSVIPTPTVAVANGFFTDLYNDILGGAVYDADQFEGSRVQDADDFFGSTVKRATT